MTRLQTINEGYRVKNSVLGKMYIREDDSSPAGLSVDLKPAAFNTALKKALKAKGVDVKSVRIVNSYNWPKCRIQVYASEIPNDIRLGLLKAAYPGLKYKDQRSGEMKDLGIGNMDDINYGIITSTQCSARPEEWAKALSGDVNESIEDGKRKLSDVLAVLMDDLEDTDKREFAEFLLKKYATTDVDYDTELAEFTKGGLPQN